MKHCKKLVALLLILCCTALLFAGCGDEQQQEEEPDKRNIAQAGGSISWPEGFDTSQKETITTQGDTMYISFNNRQVVNGKYFTPSGSSITVTGRATTESENRTEYRVTLWKETTGSREYITGGTLYLTADGSCYTGTISGLEPGNRYKVGVAYDGGKYFMSGGITISGLAAAA